MKTAVLGATGFTGEKLVEILLSHPRAELTYIASRTPKPVPYGSLFPKFYGRTELYCEPLDIEKAARLSDIIFMALPHRVSMEFVPFFLKKKKKVIDLSADYRLKDASLYKDYYKTVHKDKANLKKAVYGLTEIYREQIKKADLVANPGCYPTSVILALYPLIKEKALEGDIIVDSKSSITGAGRKAVIEYHYSNISGNIWAYKPFTHQHLPEIKSTIKACTGRLPKITFVPHVAGVEAGIYSTIYLKLCSLRKDIKKIYEKYYGSSPFIRIKPEFPLLKDAAGTNFCDIGFKADLKTKRLVVASAIDNLIKGAAGSAVQNMNVMLGIEETAGLL